MPIWILALMFLGAILLQTTVLPLLPQVIRPDLPGTIVIVTALLEGNRRGGYTGLFYGAGMDLVAAKFLGLYSLTLAITGFLVGTFERRFYKDVWLVPVTGIFSATLLKGMLVLLFGSIVGMALPEFNGYMWFVIGEAVLNIILGLPIYYWFRSYMLRNQVSSRWNIG